MSLPTLLQDTLQLPAVAAPMFLASGPDLVIETCKGGVVGSFPALNQRTSEGFEQWLEVINRALDDARKQPGALVAPYAVNLIVHATNPRLDADLALCVKHKVPIIITSLGAVPELVEQVHSYGGVVFHDVTNVRHAKKAVAAGVDGLIAVAAGAGGHAGTTSPFALVAEIRQFFQGTVLLAGCISCGQDIAAAQQMGADLAYMGTRFINTQEAMSSEGHKKMIQQSMSADILYTPNISGVAANFLKDSIRNAGYDPENLAPKTEVDFGQELTPGESQGDKQQGAWAEIWSAGQGVGSIKDIPTVANLLQQLKLEYQQAIAAHHDMVQRYM
ncbi:nitronate monooxygenase [Ferrimonas sediminum]|uniref:Nitronate monooxygenase n=1 Tax=Ferrimonas sediminum TaxID=718193 RepID=A0A1G8P4Z0_9GAMM|nr:nitronate monooxygenase family protein [Ferrimonas sediminum]SDI87366.1 nitronate monooxygenase [Ferrimonas sediminum]